MEKITYLQYRDEIHRLESTEQLRLVRPFEEIRSSLNKVNESTEALKDARALLKLLEEKVNQHNGQLRQRAGKMRTITYQRNHVKDA